MTEPHPFRRTPNDGDDRANDDQTDDVATETNDDERLAALEARNAALEERLAELESTIGEVAEINNGTVSIPSHATAGDHVDSDSPDGRTDDRGVDGSRGGTGGTAGAESSPTGTGTSPRVLPSGGQAHKVRGKFADSNGGVGVYGHNTAGSGTTYGVWGEVEPSAATGYGLYTPNDAYAGGNVELAGEIVVGDGNIDSFQTIYFGDLDKTNPKFFYNPDDGSGESIIGSSGVDYYYMGQRLQFNDGTPQYTAGPVAKASIDANGDIANSVQVKSSTWNGTESRYEIDIYLEDYWYDQWATYVTSRGPGGGVSWSAGNAGSNLAIYPSDGSQHAFQFVAFKLV